jgi:nucleoside-diphosphate-sugar epimerase
MKRVLVTGASGSLGAAVVRTLVEAGESVVATCRVPSEAPRMQALQTLPLDLIQDTGWDQLPTTIDAIVHCTAYVPAHYSAAPGEVDRLWKANGLGTLKLLMWAKAHGVAEFIYCSASHSIYQRPFPYPVTEDHPVYPDGPGTFYTLSKFVGEVFVSLFRDSLQVCNLRLSSLYGPRKTVGVVHQFVTQAQAGHPLMIRTHPESLFDLLYVQDAAEAVRLCLTNLPMRTIYNIGAGHGTTLVQLAEACREIFGSAQSPPHLHIEPSDASPVHSVLDITRAQNELGYRPAFDIRSGLRDMKKHMAIQ